MRTILSDCKKSYSRTFVSFFTVATSMLMIDPKIVYAGSGTFENGVHNFCVSVRFDASAADIQKIKTAFQNGSQVLDDATDGQHRFGKVRIVNNSGASVASEYWVNSGSGRAYATLGKYGVRGEHVNLFFNNNFQSSNGADGDAYTIAHEHAHHSYGVADEYSGPNGDAESAPASAESATLNYSLMDNYFTRGGRGPSGDGTTYTLNEFDVASNFDPDQNTWQYSINKKSVWETIAAHPTRFATLPAGLPVDAPPAPQTVTFEDAVSTQRFMLLLDRSGSMSAENRLTFAQSGANQFIDLLNTNDDVGASSFSSLPSVEFPLTTITGGGTKASAKSAVSSLQANGATNIGDGLLTALGQITAKTNRSCGEFIVLLSDGDHNTGTEPNSVIPTLKQQGVGVLAIGVGNEISPTGQSTLQNVATQTGGKYFRVGSSFDLVSLFIQLFAETFGNGLLVSAPPATIGSNQSQEVPIFVETGAKSATFALTFSNTSDDFTLTLKSPSGAIITQNSASTIPGAEFMAGANSKIFRIPNPEAGNWQMLVTTGTVTSGQYDIAAFADNDGTLLNLSVEKNNLTSAEMVKLNATPTYQGEAVVGAQVTGNAIRPDGSSVPITYLDDGLNNDGLPNDGVYGTQFNAYNAEGTYTFEAKLDNVNGTTYSGESLFSSAPSNVKPVPPFTRSASTTAVVTGKPTDTTPPDTTPPSLSVSLSPDTLWPPDKRLAEITASITAADDVDQHLTVKLVSITSNEPDTGVAKGDQPNDVQGADLGTDDRMFLLRAERAKRGVGRVYTVTYSVSDSSGNTTTKSATVTVPLKNPAPKPPKK
jgi:von Willebrand factor type A domain